MNRTETTSASAESGRRGRSPVTMPGYRAGMPSVARERLDAGIELLRLDRPEVRNALDTATLEELLDALAALAADPDLRVLVVSTTDPRALSAGADVGEALTPEQGVRRMELFGRFYRAMEAFPVPTVAGCVGNWPRPAFRCTAPRARRSTTW